jgi:hypothetical protein
MQLTNNVSNKSQSNQAHHVINDITITYDRFMNVTLVPLLSKRSWTVFIAIIPLHCKNNRQLENMGEMRFLGLAFACSESSND